MTNARYKLEEVLATKSDYILDDYLECRSASEIRDEINYLIAKACNEQEAAKKLLQIKEILSQP